MKRFFYILTFLTLCTALPICAQTKKSKKATKQQSIVIPKEYQEMPALEAFHLGLQAENGENGKKIDYKQAAFFYTIAAKKGHKVAQKNLGDCYYYGQGIEQDYNQAFIWYQKAARQDVPSSYNGLGNCYQYGHGVEQDYKEAAKWYQKAAAHHDPAGTNNLGLCTTTAEAFPKATPRQHHNIVRRHEVATP